MIKITGSIKVWANQHAKSGKVYYNTSIGTKNLEGEWNNLSLEIRFAKKLDVTNVYLHGKDIQLNHAWLGVKENDKGKSLYLFVNSFDLVK